MSEKYKFDTLSLHAGHVPDKETGSRAVRFIRLHLMFSMTQMKLLLYTTWKLVVIYIQEFQIQQSVF